MRAEQSLVYHVYIMASESCALYIGITNYLERRVRQHKHKRAPGFAAKYNTTKLVHFEGYQQVRSAISREKQVKGWSRKKKITLIEKLNPTWRDLSEDFPCS